MTPLAETLALLKSLPWPENQCAIQEGRASAVLRRGRMEATVRSAADGLVDVVYEPALHETARERVRPAVAVKLVLAIFHRERLCRVEVPEA
ncbi:hypothetical protein J8F10_22775 [Gemmata sp. G18]|uniref:Uncharacterized protein n=1 Tax=Gemmata palustris TaxID=2822762 RepID=A0ABS5BWH0_9BACT|nr:hypothetical protein [Gemmata palustris]MBP3958086.1 hypothetical protein [Gemmata palustris]